MTLLIKSTHTCGQTLVKGIVKPSQNPCCLWTSSKTFAALSKFHLNTSKSANIKVVRLFEGHTYNNWRHMGFSVEIGENLSQTQFLLFNGAMEDINFACSSCSNHWSKHRLLFTENVHLWLLCNFGIQSFWSLVWKNLSKTQSNACKRIGVSDVVHASASALQCVTPAHRVAPLPPRRPGPPVTSNPVQWVPRAARDPIPPPSPLLRHIHPVQSRGRRPLPHYRRSCQTLLFLSCLLRNAAGKWRHLGP
jgi:hypothetical protein